MIHGDRIDARLRALQKSQAWLARKLGFHQSTINGLVRGGQRSTTKIVELARVLETTPDYLTAATDDPASDAPPVQPQYAEPQMIMLPVALPPEYALKDIFQGMMLSMPDLVEPLTLPRQAELAHELARLLPSVLARVRGPFRTGPSEHDDADDDDAKDPRAAHPASRRA